MKKQIILKESDFDELQRKARLFEQGLVVVDFRFKYSYFRENLEVIKRNIDNPLLSDGDKAQINSIITEIQDRFNDFNEMRDKKINSEAGLEYTTLKEKFDKIPNWVKKLFI